MTSYFAIQGIRKEKDREHLRGRWRNSKEKERLEENGEQMNREVEVIRELKRLK